MLSFWDTARGVNLANILSRCLPKLVEKKEQKIVPLSSEPTNENISILTKEINDGWYVVTCGKNFAILERRASCL